MADLEAQKTPLAVPLTQEKGQPRIVTMSRFIEDSKKKELAMPTRLHTFDAMLRDDAVYKGVDITNLLVVKALYRGKWKAGKSTKSKQAAKFLDYCIRNMTYGTWLDACLDMTTALKYGFSSLNIVVEKRTRGEWKNSWVLKKLSPRDQKSVYGWLWNDTMTEWVGLVQKPSIVSHGKVNVGFDDGLRLLSVPRLQEQNYVVIPASQLLHIAYNSTVNNPQGDSPLMHCYDAWFEKKLVENFEISGVSKDLNGVPVLRVPSELIERANDPENYPEEAQEYLELQQDMADLHQGKTTNIVLTSDTDDKGKYLYDFELIGITGGGGKNYVTSQIIDQKRKSIYNCFGAGFLLLGQDGSGSYALSTSQTSIHGQHVERDLDQYCNAITNQLGKRLLEVNGFFFDDEDMPKFEYGLIDELSLDELGKFTQRTASVMKLTPESMKYVYEQAGLPTDGIDELDFEDKGASRSGDGMKTAGEGTSTSVMGGDSSVANVENGGVSKNFILKGDKIIDAETGDIINYHDNFNEEGYYK